MANNFNVKDASGSTIAKSSTQQGDSSQADNVVVLAGTTGGYTPYSFIAAGGTNQDSQVVKASAGVVGGIDLFNTSAAVRYVKLYDKATGPTSSDTPIKRILLPAGGGVVRAALIGFSSGISLRITTGIADNDTGAATANDVIVNLDFK